MSLLERFILTEIMALVTKSAVLIKGLACKDGCLHIGVSLYLKKLREKVLECIFRPGIRLDAMF